MVIFVNTFYNYYKNVQWKSCVPCVPETYEWMACPFFYLILLHFFLSVSFCFLKPWRCHSDNRENRGIISAKSVYPELYPYHVSEQNYPSKDRNAICWSRSPWHPRFLVIFVLIALYELLAWCELCGQNFRKWKRLLSSNNWRYQIVTTRGTKKLPCITFRCFAYSCVQPYASFVFQSPVTQISRW